MPMRVRFLPMGITQEAEGDQTLLDLADQAGIGIERLCGGRGTCAKCRVIVQGSVTPVTSAEERGLTTTELAQGYRLACQTRPMGDLQVTVPSESRIARVSILSEGIQDTLEIEPWVERHVLAVPETTLDEQLADLSNLRRAWETAELGPFVPTLTAMRHLPDALRAHEGNIAVVRVDDDIAEIAPTTQAQRLLGIAFDIGTTTVVGYLMDLESGEELSVASELNPQTRFGDDVVSRIQHAEDTPDGLHTLQRDIIAALNRIIKQTVAQARVRSQGIFALTAVGNTTMQHLLLGVKPTYLAQSPYVPVFTDGQLLSARSLGLDTHPEAHMWLLPSIAGWVGADTVGVILATGIHQADEISLAIDIGTNGEMALGSRERLITCSTAAGPAFEGAHISCGMRASDGAIDAVQIGQDIALHTIDGGTPRGLCGSGLVDAISELLRVEVIDRRGKLLGPEQVRVGNWPALATRLQGENRHRRFLLTMGHDDGPDDGLALTQRDIRELQLAKGAIRSGVEILIKELGITSRDVKKVYLAGAFGNYIRAESALRIGLIPDLPNASITPVGNAAGSGAKMALLSRSARSLATSLLEHVEYLELSGRADFQQEFAEAMLF